MIVEKLKVSSDYQTLPPLKTGGKKGFKPGFKHFRSVFDQSMIASDSEVERPPDPKEVSALSPLSIRRKFEW